jgi:hypothetical protein
MNGKASKSTFSRRMLIICRKMSEHIELSEGSLDGSDTASIVSKSTSDAISLWETLASQYENEPDNAESRHDSLFEFGEDVDEDLGATPLDTIDDAVKTTGRSTSIDEASDAVLRHRPHRNDEKHVPTGSSHMAFNYKRTGRSTLPQSPATNVGRSRLQLLRAALEATLAQRVTVYTTFLLLIVGCTVTAIFAAWTASFESPSVPVKSTFDDDFFSSVSQGLGGILGIFCMIIPLIERNRLLQPDLPVSYPKIFRWLLGFSVVTSVLSMATQRSSKPCSIVLGYLSMATQLIATLCLVVGSTEKITLHRRALDQMSVNHLVVSQTLLNVQRQAAAGAAP